MNDEIKRIIGKINFYLKILDVIQIIMTFYQFLVEHDYSFATILGISSFILSIVIYLLEKLSEAEENIHNTFGNIYPTNKLEKFILILSICYGIANCIILIIAEIYCEDADAIWGFIILYVFPALFSGLILFLKSIDDSLSETSFIAYQISCATPFITMICIMIFEEGISFGSFIFIIGGMILYYPVYKVSGYIVKLCSKHWHE